MKQLISTRAWFMFILPQAILLPVIGSVARAHAALNLKSPSMTPYIVQHVMFGMIPSLTAILLIMIFTRVIWLTTPNSVRNRKNIGMPIHQISLLWGLAFVIPDIVKGIAQNINKPKPGEHPDPASLSNRIETICLVVQFFSIAGWTVFATVFMRKSRHWPPPTEGERPGVREIGWAMVACGAIITVSVS